jgi:Mn-dependent DtxR family transcriptional regulator
MATATASKSKPRGTRAQEDYLEQIHTLIEDKGYARVVDIAGNLGIAQASVTGMIQRMDSDGLVEYEKYRGVVLTDEGTAIAKAIVRRHESLAEFFALLGLEEADVYDDIEGMEHHMSTPVLAAIRGLTEELERQPALLRRVREKMAEAK